MRVTICWAVASSYAGACFRALTAKFDPDLRILHLRLSDTPLPWASDLFAGLSHTLFKAKDLHVSTRVREVVLQANPDLLVLSGWFFPPYLRLIHEPALRVTRVIVGMDTPWRGNLRQWLNCFRLRQLVRRSSAFIVAGDRSRQYARRLGVPEQRIRTGYYGFDFQGFAARADQRHAAAVGWPRRFLFTGRYIPEKGLCTLLAAYQSYRRMVAQPWDLTCCGVGPEAPILANQLGVIDLGYVQPPELPALFARHGTFILPSDFEPWGVVIAEAAASGLPVICSSACGAGLDIVRSYHNGLVVAPKDVAGLARAMRWIHEHESELPAMGRRGQALAEAFSAEAWATRWYNYFLEIMDEPSSPLS